MKISNVLLKPIDKIFDKEEVSSVPTWSVSSIETVDKTDLAEDAKAYTFFESDKASMSSMTKDVESKDEDEDNSISLDNYEWVEGYKAVNADLTAYNNFQYEIGKIYSLDLDEKEKVCDKGFHFCQDLKDTGAFYPANKSRFFKVKALINTKKYQYLNGEWKTKDCRYSVITSYNSPTLYIPNETKASWIRADKIVAKKIILMEEVDEETVFETFKDNLKYPTERGVFSPTDFETFKKYRFKGNTELVCLFAKKQKEDLISLGYSESFSTILIDKICGKGTLEFSSTEFFKKTSAGLFDPKYLRYELLSYAKALAKEGVSKDMRAYLLFSKL